MTELAVGLLRVLLWLFPALLAFLAWPQWRQGRTRVAVGLLLAALLVAFLVKPVTLGLASLLLGILLGWVRR